MSTPQQILLRRLLEAGLEYGDDGSEASEDAIRFVHALTSSREAAREVVREIIEEEICREFKQES